MLDGRDGRHNCFGDHFSDIAAGQDLSKPGNHPDQRWNDEQQALQQAQLRQVVPRLNQLQWSFRVACCQNCWVSPFG